MLVKVCNPKVRLCSTPPETKCTIFLTPSDLSRAYLREDWVSVWIGVVSEQAYSLQVCLNICHLLGISSYMGGEEEEEVVVEEVEEHHPSHTYQSGEDISSSFRPPGRIHK